MLLTIERVILLRTVDIFASTPSDVLVAVAGILEEKEIAAGARIIEKGELGTSMYVVASGSVRVHDGDDTLAVLGRGHVFGELAALDPEPRTASVTALEETTLLRLEHDALFEVMAERVEVAHALIRFLVRRYGRGTKPGASAPRDSSQARSFGARAEDATHVA